MQFIIPQFLDVETKIIGPISGRQFIILLATAGLLFLFYQLLPFFLFVVLGVIVAAFGGGLAFAKVNGQSMHYFVLNMIETLKRPRIKYWQRAFAFQTAVTIPSVVKPVFTQKIVTPSRLASMSLMVDTGGAYAPEEQQTTPRV